MARLEAKVGELAGVEAAAGDLRALAAEQVRPPYIIIIQASCIAFTG